ncbi:MAG: 50S ribosomal protein L18 [Patescibacteria group bacterium]
MKINTKKEQRTRRQARIRAKVSGTKDRPRLAVFKSNTNIYVQIIDDIKGQTLVSFSSKDIKKGKPLEKAKGVGVEIAKKALAKKITKIVFDRGGFLYTGHIKALADGAREGGLKF